MFHLLCNFHHLDGSKLKLDVDQNQPEQESFLKLVFSLFLHIVKGFLHHVWVLGSKRAITPIIECHTMSKNVYHSILGSHRVSGSTYSANGKDWICNFPCLEVNWYYWAHDLKDGALTLWPLVLRILLQFQHHCNVFNSSPSVPYFLSFYNLSHHNCR